MHHADILVVDDDRDLVRAVQAFLQARGFRVATAFNGAEAEKAIRTHVPDAIVLDIMMDTDNEGFQLAFSLKNDPATRHVPIVIVSGFTEHLESKYDRFEFILGENWPAAHLFEKPVDLDKLATTLERLLAEEKAHLGAMQPQ